MSGPYNVQPSERTQIIRGSENVIDASAGLKFISNVKTKIDACVDYTRPALTIDIESISKYLADIKAKSGIRLREQDKLGAIVLIEQMAIQHGVKVRFLTPASEWVKQQAREVGKYTDIRYIPD